jgi:hypothetical protein
MRREHTILLTMGSALLISSSAAFAAGPPINYGQYTSDSSGNITLGVTSGGTFTPGSSTTSDCPVDSLGGSCGVPITGNGFMQRQINTSDGSVYFQTIILEKDTAIPTGGGGYADLSNKPFADESFVKQHASSGIADSSHVFASATSSDTSTFTGDTAINTGWAYDTGTDRISVTQSINDDTIGRRSNMTFTLTDASSNNTEPVITLDQTVYLPQDPTNTSVTTTDKQRFYLKQLKITPTTPGNTGTTLALPTSTPTKPTTLTYANNDILQVMWVGQTVGGGTSTGGAQTFGAQSYTVNPNGTTSTATTPTASVNYADQTSHGPFNWDTTLFLAAPTF